jgi:hypothetical protein
MRGLCIVWLLSATGFLYLAEARFSFAQTPNGKGQADQTDALRVAPNAPRPTPEVRSEPEDERGRADICEELVAFVEKAAADTSKPTTQANGAARSPAAPPAPATSNASPDTSQRQSGVSAPVPQGETASAPVKLSLEEARSLAGAHDVRGCQRVVQQMRRAGVALPPGLLALAALREDLVSEMPRPAH